MKSSRYFIIATISALMLVSCTKLADGSTSEGNEVSKERVITIGFAETRTALNGLHSTFEENDPIALSDGQNSETVYVKISNSGVATITIPSTLSGDIYAVYPASAADGYGGYIVSASQTGEFKDADICTSKIPESCRSAVFTTQVSILRFYVDESIGVQSISIESTGDENIATGSKTITADPDGDTQIYEAADGRICYVSVLPGVTASDLEFTSQTTTQEENDGEVTCIPTSSVSLVGNTMYNAFIPYYIKVNVGTEQNPVYQKWGYCNVGAFLPEEFGAYFAWGETTGHYLINNYTAHQDLGSYTDAFDDVEFRPHSSIEVLPLQFDAANVIWGGKWRMPTVDEAKALIGYDEEDEGGTIDGKYQDGYYLVWEDALTFPAAGYAEGTTICEPYPNPYFCNCYYWTSSYVETDCAYCICFEEDILKGEMNSNIYEFYETNLGMSIRPIWGEASEPDEPDTNITGGSFDPMGKIYF